MNIIIREYQDKDIPSMIDVWNEVVEDGNAFPQIESLTYEQAKNFLHLRPIPV